MQNFWINEALRTLALFWCSYGLGLWVKKTGVRVNYTRKILHFVLFFLPIYLASRIPFEPSIKTVALSGVILVTGLTFMSEPFRSRSPFLATAFVGFDRPEDRPYTLLWLSTQLLAGYAVLIVMLLWLAQYGQTDLIYITVLIGAVGDGLAEPVGVRFGKRKYRVRALFVEREYTRSIEGSLCVFVSGVLAVGLFQSQFTALQFFLALAIIPLAMTLTEAFSPHTWDGPFLFFVGGTTTVAVLELAAYLA